MKKIEKDQYIKVYISSKDRTSRNLVSAKLIEDRGTTVIVELPDGNIIKRKKSRDFPQEKKSDS